MRQFYAHFFMLSLIVCFRQMAFADCSPPVIQDFIVNDQSGNQNDNKACNNTVINFGVNIQFGSGQAPYEYLWTSSVATGVTINNPNSGYTSIYYQNTSAAIVTTTITLLVTDANGCTATQSVDIDMIPNLIADVNFTENSGTPNDGGICFGDQMSFDVDMNIADTYTYLWNEGWTTETVTFSPPYTNSTSFYYVTVTNSAGCTGQGFEIAKGYTEIISTVSYVPACDVSGTDAVRFELSGGNPTASGYFFQLNITPNQWQHSPFQVNVPSGFNPGDLIDSLIKDEKGCREPVNFILPSHPGYLAATEQIIDSGCDPTGAVDQTVTGGTAPYGFLWSNNATTEDLNNVLAGTYTCTITDVYGCTHINEAIVGHDPNGQGCALLPVEVTYFRAQADKEMVQLEWETATELSNEGFEILSSEDGQHFEYIGFVAGAGSATTETAYSFTHRHPYAGENYYKLKQIDFDGSIAYSKIIRVIVESSMSVVVYPSPIPAGQTAHLRYQLSKGEWLTYQLIDLHGHVYQDRQLYLEAGLHELPIDLSQMPSGIYYVKTFTANREQHVLKLVVE